METVVIAVVGLVVLLVFGQVFVAVVEALGRVYERWPIFGTNPGIAVLRWEPDGRVQAKAREVFSQGFSARGFEVSEVLSSWIRAEREGEVWTFGTADEGREKFEVKVHKLRKRQVAECLASFDSARPFEQQLEVGVRTWSRAVQFHGVFSQHIGDDAAAMMSRASVRSFLVDSVEVRIEFGFDPASIIRSEVDPVIEVLDVCEMLDKALPADEDVWFEELEPVMQVAEAGAAVAYYEERVRRGHMTRLEAAVRYLRRRPERRRRLGEVFAGVDPAALVGKVGEEQIMNVYMEMLGVEGVPVGDVRELGAVCVEVLGAERVRASVLERVRGADPSSRLHEAAHELFDLSRFGGALTETSPGGGELTQAGGDSGGLSEVE